MKFYAVKIGRKPGIYESWSECEQQTKGFSGAIFKSFSNIKDAATFVGGEMNRESGTDKTLVLAQIFEDEKEEEKEERIEIYTDGSHIKGTNLLGWGAYSNINGVEHKLAGQINSQKLREYDIHEKVSNPTAEFIAFVSVLEKLETLSFKKKVIFKIDYDGVGNWMNGTWKATKSYIRKLRDRAQFLIDKMGLDYVIEHVPGHSGIKGNEMADQLAKSRRMIDEFKV